MTATPLQTSKFSEISVQLAKAIDNVTAKKKALDDATAAINKAASEHNDAVENAKSLRSQLEAALDVSLGKELKSKIG